MADAEPLTGPPVSLALRAVLAGTASLAIATPLLIVSVVKIAPHPPATAAKPPAIIPETIIPAVEPVVLQNVSQEGARAINAAIPFSTAPNPAARPFKLGDPPIDSARAADCMAAALLYEAGDDATGQQAVAQVIINRVRHPAFPKSVCGVVFQGSEKSTGCQFTFSCDGALVRHKWSDEAWARARAQAAAALAGKVYAAVGHATHYHTDWVVPYWSASLDKVTAVGTHLFFRWTGWWGTPPAFTRQVDAVEPVVAALAPYSPAHRLGLLPVDGTAVGVGVVASALPPLAPTALDPDAFLVSLDGRLSPDSYRAYAEQSCGTRAYCKFMAWSAGTLVPKALPLDTAQIATMAFSYLRDDARGLDKALWNCAAAPRPDKRECMKTQSLRVSRPDPNDPAPLLYDRPELLVPKPWLILPKAPAKPDGAAPGSRTADPVTKAATGGAPATRPVAMPALAGANEASAPAKSAAPK